jgi:DNA-binding IclR family transcriptional regulator
MTKAHAIRKLLEHGPLAISEIIEITGWPAKQARRAVYGLSEWGQIIRVDGKWTL